jgi:hypothetical protein
MSEEIEKTRKGLLHIRGIDGFSFEKDKDAELGGPVTQEELEEVQKLVGQPAETDPHVLVNFWNTYRTDPDFFSNTEISDIARTGLEKMGASPLSFEAPSQVVRLISNLAQLLGRNTPSSNANTEMFLGWYDELRAKKGEAWVDEHVGADGLRILAAMKREVFQKHGTLATGEGD